MSRILGLCVIILMHHLLALGQDLIVNGTVQTIPGGNYGIIVVKNSGVLTVSGTLSVEQLLVTAQGKLTVASNIICQNLTVETNSTIQANGATNEVKHVTIGGTLTGHGTWSGESFLIQDYGTFTVTTIDASKESSGLFRAYYDTFVIEPKGVLFGEGVGNDQRGQGHDWYANASGGGHAGIGGSGYWGSSGAGNRGQAYGFAYTYDAPMGGAGGLLGGAGILIRTFIQCRVDGSINANGKTSESDNYAGGAGGSILIDSPEIVLNGNLTVNGGNGGYNSGGGSGGRIKLFYRSVVLPDVSSKLSATGGKQGGFRNTQNGSEGTIYRNHVPYPLMDDATPKTGSNVTNQYVTFSFNVIDQSNELDQHNDSLSPIIEISSDGFKTIAYVFDQDTYLGSWSKLAYFSGDRVSFTAPMIIPEGSYEYRIRMQDQSVTSEWSDPVAFTVGKTDPNQGPSAMVVMTPTVVINGTVGKTYRILYTPDMNVPQTWYPLASVTLTSSTQYYFDVASISAIRRFYKIEE